MHAHANGSDHIASSLQGIGPCTFSPVDSRQPRYKQPQPTCRRPDLGHITHLANLSLELRVILRSVEGADYAWRTTVDRRVRAGANIEFGEGIVFDVHFVLWAAFALGLDFTGLEMLAGLSQTGERTELT